MKAGRLTDSLMNEVMLVVGTYFIVLLVVHFKLPEGTRISEEVITGNKKSDSLMNEIMLVVGTYTEVGFRAVTSQLMS